MSRKLKESSSATQQPQPKDRFKKPLTNEEKLNNLAWHLHQLEQAIGDVNSRLISLSRAKLGAKEMAIFMRDSEANSNYMKNLNRELDLAAAQEAKKQSEALSAFAVPEEKANGSTVQPGGNSSPQREGGLETPSTSK